MATDVSICSQALLLLGDKPIASFDENQPVTGVNKTVQGPRSEI